MAGEPSPSSVHSNWQRLLEEVHAACDHAGRPHGSVRIVGVSKYVDADLTRELVMAGCHDLGESRPQRMIDKVEVLRDLPIQWHLIGHLQRNKAKRMVELAAWIHSVDSLKLLETIAQHASQVGRCPKLLIEVNISGDADKHGFAPETLMQCWPQIAAYPSLPIVGLMAMAGLHADADQTRHQFAAVRELRDSLSKQYNAILPEISMGMSGDFDAAIQEGATMIRIGSRLFA